MSKIRTITATLNRNGDEIDVEFGYEIDPGERADHDYPGSEPNVLIYAKEKLSEEEYCELERVAWENEK